VKGEALMNTPMETIIVEQRIRNFILENFLFGHANGLKDSDSFLEFGIIDSTGILELVAFVGETYGIVVEDEDMIPDNLDSIDRVAAYVRRKQYARRIITPGGVQ
jgi:acyl carrier protein